MTPHLAAVLFTILYAMSWMLAAVDEQPKPVWTTAHVIRAILSFALLPLIIYLVAVSW